MTPINLFNSNLGVSSTKLSHNYDYNQTPREAGKREDKPDPNRMAQDVSSNKRPRKNYLDFDPSDSLLTFANIKSTDPMLLFVKSDIKLELD